VGGIDFEELPTRDCSPDELHVENKTDPNSVFFKPHPNSKRDLEFYYKKLKCVNLDKIKVQGDYNSPRTRSFVILFEKCSNSTFEGVCKSEAEINSWIRRKFVIISMN
jgi:hypothetical protein